MDANQPVAPQPSPAISPEPQAQTSCLGGFIKSLVISAVVVVVCAIAWGAIAYFTDKIYAMAAIVIGLVVSVAAMSGFSKVNFGIALLMLVPCVALTLVAVALGDFIFYTLVVMREGVDLMNAVQVVAGEFIEYEMTSQDGRASLILGGIGALVGFFYAARSGGK